MQSSDDRTWNDALEAALDAVDRANQIDEVPSSVYSFIRELRRRPPQDKPLEVHELAAMGLIQWPEMPSTRPVS